MDVDAFRTGTECSEVFKNNIGRVNGFIREGIEAQKLVVLMEIARSLDLIAQAVKPTVLHVNNVA